MFIFRLIRRAVCGVVFLGIAAAAIIALSGCGGNLIQPENPETPSIEEPGTDTEQPDEPSVPVTSKFAVTFGETDAGAGEEIYAVLPSNGQAVFEISGTDSYTVSIGSTYGIVNGIIELVYSIDGGNYLPSGDDYTGDFIIMQQSDSLTIICTPGYYDYETLLLRKWSASEVEFKNELMHEYPYEMTITSSEGEVITVLLKQE